jgi:hypothetical protein
MLGCHFEAFSDDCPSWWDPTITATSGQERRENVATGARWMNDYSATVDVRGGDFSCALCLSVTRRTESRWWKWKRRDWRLAEEFTK